MKTKTRPLLIEAALADLRQFDFDVFSDERKAFDRAVELGCEFYYRVECGLFCVIKN